MLAGPPKNTYLLVCVTLYTRVCMCVCQSDEDYETYDTVLELDEVLNLDSDTERAAYIQVTSLLHSYLYYPNLYSSSSS